MQYNNIVNMPDNFGEFVIFIVICIANTFSPLHTFNIFLHQIKNKKYNDNNNNLAHLISKS